MRLQGRLKKREAASEEQPRVMAAGIVWTTDHEHYTGEVQAETRIVSDPYRRRLWRRSGMDASRSAGAQ